MKKLYIVRHSKAQEMAPDHTDFNRCLAVSGIEKAELIAEKLAMELGSVDLMISSPACRAIETARIFSKALNYPEPEIRTDELLYHFGATDRALSIVSGVADDVQTLVLFGHNPTFNALAWELCSTFRNSMPTSAVVGVGFKFEHWQDIYTANGKLLTYLTKKTLV